MRVGRRKKRKKSGMVEERDEGGVARARARDYKSERKREPQLQTPRQSQR